MYFLKGVPFLNKNKFTVKMGLPYKKEFVN